MQLVGWVVLCALFSYALRRRALLCIVGILCLWVLVPSVAGGLVTGVGEGPLSFHPATWLILTTLAAQLLHDPRALLRAVAQHVFLAIALALVIAVAVLTTRYGSAGGGMALIVDQLVGPVCLFVLVVGASAQRPESLNVLRATVLSLATVASLIAVVQWVSGGVILYERFYATRAWFARTGPTEGRWMATLDHPLTLSFLICVAVPLLVGISRAWLQLALIAVLGAGLVIAQSRVGLVAFALGVLYVIARTRATAAVRILLAVLVTGAVSFVSATAISDGIGRRIADDTGSADARAAAFEFFFRSWRDFLVVGDGFTSSYGVAQAAGLGTSLESSILMYAVDIGVVFALLYFGSQLVIVVRGVGRVRYPGLLLTATIALVLPQTYSALGSGSAVGALLWVVLAMVVAATDLADRGEADPSVGSLAGTGHRTVSAAGTR